jgi:hypothetical protein
MAAAHAVHAVSAALVIAVAHVVMVHAVMAKAAATIKLQFAGPPIKVATISICQMTNFMFHWITVTKIKTTKTKTLIKTLRKFQWIKTIKESFTQRQRVYSFLPLGKFFTKFS